MSGKYTFLMAWAATSYWTVQLVTDKMGWKFCLSEVLIPVAPLQIYVVKISPTLHQNVPQSYRWWEFAFVNPRTGTFSSYGEQSTLSFPISTIAELSSGSLDLSSSVM